MTAERQRRARGNGPRGWVPFVLALVVGVLATYAVDAVGGPRWLRAVLSAGSIVLAVALAPTTRWRR